MCDDLTARHDGRMSPEARARQSQTSPPLLCVFLNMTSRRDLDNVRLENAGLGVQKNKQRCPQNKSATDCPIPCLTSQPFALSLNTKCLRYFTCHKTKCSAKIIGFNTVSSPYLCLRKCYVISILSWSAAGVAAPGLRWVPRMTRHGDLVRRSSLGRAARDWNILPAADQPSGNMTIVQ